MCLNYSMGWVIIPKPNLSSHEDINSRCCRFDLFRFCRSQSVSAVTAVVTVQVVAVPTGRLRSIVTDVAGKFNSTIEQRLGCSDSFWLFFAYITNLLGGTEM